MEPGDHASPEFFYLLSSNSTAQPKQENVSWGVTKVSILVFVVSATIATVFGNSLVLASYCKYATVRTPSTTAMLSLSIVDLLLSAVFVMNTITVAGHQNKEGICRIASTLSEVRIYCYNDHHYQFFCLCYVRDNFVVKKSDQLYEYCA